MFFYSATASPTHFVPSTPTANRLHCSPQDARVPDRRSWPSESPGPAYRAEDTLDSAVPRTPAQVSKYKVPPPTHMPSIASNISLPSTGYINPGDNQEIPVTPGKGDAQLVPSTPLHLKCHKSPNTPYSNSQNYTTPCYNSQTILEGMGDGPWATPLINNSQKAVGALTRKQHTFPSTSAKTREQIQRMRTSPTQGHSSKSNNNIDLFSGSEFFEIGK